MLWLKLDPFKSTFHSKLRPWARSGSAMKGMTARLMTRVMVRLKRLFPVNRKMAAKNRAAKTVFMRVSRIRTLVKSDEFVPTRPVKRVT